MNRTIVALLILAAAGACLAQTPEETLRKAEQIEAAGQVSRAADLYRQFLKDHPDHSQILDARFHYAKCCDALGMVDEAVAQLDAIVQSGQKKYAHRKDALYMLGKLHGSLKNYDKAAAAFEMLLAEGGGLYEDEAMDLCGGYYAILKKTDEAAAKFNILKRRDNARYAEQAGYKLAALWIKAARPDLAAAAVEELAAQFPRNPHIPGLIVQAADLFRAQKKYDQAIALCEQVASTFPKSPEAQAGRYVTGLCHVDRKEFAKAVEVFDRIAKAPESRKEGLAAEALFQSAQLYQVELNDVARAMQLYQDAATAARQPEVDSERTRAIAEQCYFTLAEFHYEKKNYPVALEFYLLLRGAGSRLNVASRIMKCQMEMGSGETDHLTSPEDLALITRKIEDNPGTFVAAEGEVFLVDRELAEATRSGRDAPAIAPKYEAILKKYGKEILAQQSLEPYVRLQIGLCLAQGAAKESLTRAMESFARSAEIDPAGPYATSALENLALAADKAGERDKAFATYKRLFDLSTAKLDKAKDDKELQKVSSQYLKSVLSRADAGDSLERAMQLAQQTIEQKGAFSALARDAQFYLGELYFLKKDYSAAARQFGLFVKMYGPKQDASGNVLDAPWRPGQPEGDENVQQVYEAAIRIAHSWYMQGHSQNMVKAYEWIVRNFSVRNLHLAEAQYWLAMELAKGPDDGQAEGKRRTAEALWKNVVNPSLDFSDRKFAEQYHYWVRQRDSDAEQYVRTAALKAGKLFGEVGEHEKAAGIFAAYLELFSPSRRPPAAKRQAESDEMYSIARYALGREYIALGNVTKLIECYKGYLRGLRDDRFRPSALRLLGYHAGKAGKYDEAAEAYATLLDEYGDNTYGRDGKAVPVPRKEWIRQGGWGWDGVRLPPPKDLDLGEVRFSLGYLYWKQEDWARCVQVLTPFVDDARLGAGKSAGNALYMAGRSRFKLYDYRGGVAVIERLIREHPQYEAVEEATVYAARGYCELEQWKELDRLCRTFLAGRAASDRRPYFDLYAALCRIGLGQPADGVARLKGIVNSTTYEDVKADACYYLGRQAADDQTALDWFEKSISVYPRETSVLAAAKCCLRMKKYDRAGELAERVGRDFPGGDPKSLAEAKSLLGEVTRLKANSGGVSR